MSNRGRRYTEEQIIGILKEAEKAERVGDVIRRHGVAVKTYYRWKAKYSGMDVSDARRLKQLEEENRKLKRLVADQALENRTLKDLLGKEW
jgi:putative transposase